MAILFREPTVWEIIVSHIYNYVIVATIVSMLFVYYLFRTRAPLKEVDEDETTANGHHHQDSKNDRSKSSSYKNGSARLVANGDVDVISAEGDQELLQTILHGMHVADAMAAEDEDDESGHHHNRVARSRKVTENEDEEAAGEDDGGGGARRRQIIREVTVRKIFLPPDARYADVENAAKRLIGADAASQGTSTTPGRKDSDTGGTDFRMAIKNIREASKRLEDEEDS